MAKLYLIRRDLHSFSGPMTVAEMKDAHKRLQFGLADEVSGHCGPWVQLDDITNLKKHYPDVARIVHEEMLAGWGVSDHTGARLVGDGETKKIAVKGTKSVGLAVTFLVIALVAFAAAVYMASSSTSKLSGKVGPVKDPTPEEAQSYLDKGELAELDQYLAANVGEIVARINKQKKLESAWLPYLRLYAFNNGGEVPGIPPKTLRGAAAASAPSDCSLKVWRKRWRSSMKHWNGLLVERKLVRAHWARVLAWDPHWIKRRDNKGWLLGQNYYTGCLVMAERALAEMATDTSLVQTAGDWDRSGFPRVRQRLQWILEASRGGAAQPGGDQTSPLGVWTCLEAAKDLPALQKCRDGQPAADVQDVLATYTEERYVWNVVRLVSAQSGALPEATLTLLGALANKANKGDFYTRFDYRAEQRLLRTLARPAPQPLPIEKTVERVNAEFPDVRLAH